MSNKSEPKFKVGSKVKDIDSGTEFTIGKIEYSESVKFWVYSSIGWYWYPESDLELVANEKSDLQQRAELLANEAELLANQIKFNERNGGTLPSLAATTQFLTFYPASTKPTKDMVGRTAILLNPCDGYHLAEHIWFDENDNFEGFYEWGFASIMKPDFYVAWALLPEPQPIIDKLAPKE